MPVTRFIDAKSNLDLLANGISFTRVQSRNLVLKYLGRQSCCGGECGPTDDCGPEPSAGLPLVQLGSVNGPTQGLSSAQPSGLDRVANEFFSRVVDQQLGAENLFRITITSFLDAYNFDVRRVMKCCTHHVLPSGHVIPFCAYNVLYREGHVQLPALRELQVK